jgi:hypothetical protein
MKLVLRLVILLGSVLVLLASAAFVTMQITSNIWIALSVVFLVSVILANLVDEVLAIGTFFGQRAAAREEEDPDADIRAAASEALSKVGLRIASMQRVGAGYEEDEDAPDAEKIIIRRLQNVAEAIQDPDMKEFTFHFKHIATDCPGSLAHVRRMEDLVVHLDTRLKASPIRPESDDTRPLVH